MHTWQPKSHNQDTVLAKTAETPQKAAVSAASASRVPAWAGGMNDLIPSGLVLQDASAVPGIRAKLAISQPNDPYEQEADRVAEQVMTMPQSQANQLLRTPQNSSSRIQDVHISPLMQRQAQQTDEQELNATLFEAQESSATQEAAPGPVDIQSSTKSVQPQKEREESFIAAKEQSGHTPRVDSQLEHRLSNSSRSTGYPLPSEVRTFFEPRFGQDFSGVRVHTDDDSVQMNRQVNALAFTHGQDIYFGSSQYVPHSTSGQQLLAHELTHTVQQNKERSLQRREGKEKRQQIPNEFIFRIPVTRKMDKNEAGVAVLMTVFGMGRPEAKRLMDSHAWFWGDPDFKGITDEDVARGYHEVAIDSSTYFRHVDRLAGLDPKERGKSGASPGATEREAFMKTLPDDERKKINQETNRLFWQRTHFKPGKKLGESPEDRAQARLWKDIRDKVLLDKQKEKLNALPENIKFLLGDEKTLRPEKYGRLLKAATKLQSMKPEELQLYRILFGRNAVRFAKPGEEPEIQDPAELLRLYQQLQDRIRDLQISEQNQGQTWLKLARFLDANKDKIEGIIQGNPPGKLTQEKLEKIITEYGKYIAAEPVTEDKPKKDQPETLEDFDQILKYDPGWQKLSPEDRKLLIEYARAKPEELTDKKVDFTRVTTTMKVNMALKLSKSWPKEILEAAKEAFSDPLFLITLVLVTGVYVGLWLTPEPTMITKIAAGTLTAVMLTQFAWSDLYGFAKAWFDLSEACSRAKSVAQLQIAGDKFAEKVGQVGFDICMFIVTFAIGKAVGPKIQKIGARRGVIRAETAVKAIESEPGSGVPKQATGEAAKLLDNAKSKVGTKTGDAKAVLDALEDSLKNENAKKGLRNFRKNQKGAGTPEADANALKALESRSAGGEDISKFLEERGMGREEAAAVRKKLIEARGRLARAKMIEIEAIKDSTLRKAAEAEWIENLRADLKELRVFDDIEVRKAAESNNINELIGELGEAIARALLKAEYAGKRYKILANVEIARLMRGYKTIADWQAAERLKGPQGTPEDIGRLRQHNGKLWQSVAEVDAMVAEEGSGGKLLPIELEQTKTGMRDRAVDAEAQNRKAIDALKDREAGDRDVSVFERTGKNTYGKELTGNLDLSKLSSTKTTTRGLPEKGFGKDVLYPRDVLEKVADSIIKKGLPPTDPGPVITPVPHPRKEREEVGVPK